MTQLVKLECGVQQYEWGKAAADSYVAKMKHMTDRDGKYAELWVGTHVNCPSKTMSGELLGDFLCQSGVKDVFFSPLHQSCAEFRDKLPFLLKILSIQTALSLQAHPNKTLAQKLHVKDPKNYKDPNHKPELIVALTPFEALCCFRPLHEILRLVHSTKPLDALLGNSARATTKENEKDIIKGMLRSLYSYSFDRHARALRENIDDITVKGKAATDEDRLFLRLMSEYPDDIGCWMVYFLNYVQMEPGQGLFLSDSEPHAYIYGDGVEIMANSDNVVRAGLTPKWKDIETLLNMLSYSTDSFARAKHERRWSVDGGGWDVQRYCPPKEFLEFSLYRMEHVLEEAGKTSVVLPTIGLGFCLYGEATVNDISVTEGECFAVPYGQMTSEAKGKCLLFVASMNDLSAHL